MFLSSVLYKLSNMSTLPNSEVRWKFLFQEPAITKVHSELRRPYNKPLTVVEANPSVGGWSHSALNLVRWIEWGNLLGNLFLSFSYYCTIIEAEVTICTEQKQMYIRWYPHHHQPVVRLSYSLRFVKVTLESK